MIFEADSSATAFNSLPIELNKVIAHQLDTDKDIATYRLVSRSTNDAIDADHGSFWRTKFREKYALRDSLMNLVLKNTYQLRAKLLRRGTGYDFFRGHKKRESDVVAILRDLILESFHGSSETDDYGRPHCKNLKVLANFVLNSKLLLNDRRAPPPARGEPDHVDPALAAIKLMCSHFLFELDGAKHNVFAVEESQRFVYMATNSAPMYRGPSDNLTEVNIEWVSHCLNFFRHHMMNEDTGTLYDSMEDLSINQKPSAWQEPLRTGAYPLGAHWKGTYAFLEPTEIRKLRRLTDEQVGDEFFQDKNVDEGKIQSLQLDFVQGTPLRWPEIFEQKLKSLRLRADPVVKAQTREKPELKVPDSVQFTGVGVDLDDDFNAIGWLNALPEQHGIPGWQRITFMKHFMDDFDQLEQDNLWAYEGVVLPGGRIILGRWWYASEPAVNFNSDYNGPFIFWAVDEPEFEEDDEDGDSEDE